MKVILWSIRTFWYKGLAKYNEKSRVLKKGLFLEKIIVGTEKPKKKKFLYGVWGLISSRYDIKWSIYDIISNI